MKLSTQITLFIVLILILSLGSMTILSYYQMKNILNAQLEDKLMNIAAYVSEDYMVKEAFRDGKKVHELNEHIEKIRNETKVEFITVFDMNSTRLTHPFEENVGRKFKGGDQTRALTKADRYISKAEGTLGTSVRAFAPIFNEGRQIGAVCVGSTITEIKKETFEKTQQFIPIITVVMLMGICCAIILTSNIKYEILGLEPKEITLLFKEKEAILENVKEGIITLNEEGNLIQYNKEAARILGFKENAADISGFIKSSKISPLLKEVQRDDVFEVKIRPGVTILCKYNVLRNDKKQVIGQVINFRDLTEVKKMSEELTGIKKMAWSLRAQNHEFMNKLHTISGLIQLEEYDEAIKYISKTANSGNDISRVITGRIKNMNIAALLLSKYYKAEELRISLKIDKQSYLDKIPELISEDDLVSVIGNLIENSFEAVNVGNGKVFFKIAENSGNLVIEVSDNGPGIPDDIKEKIYERNFSTNSNQRGYGLYIVKNIVEDADGTIALSVDDGTSWHVEIPVKDGDKV
ncbi:MAG TPA: sensor histidine kinase [Clostridiales bacterium]|nr:sensor histidine kinase [Clostridiales bacterium]